ncbi:MAG: hypothetical protein ACI4TT_04240, partial [Christensenellales bacterium]
TFSKFVLNIKNISKKFNLAVKRVLVLTQVVVASLQRRQAHKYSQLRQRVRAGRANARHSFSFFLFCF